MPDDLLGHVVPVSTLCVPSGLPGPASTVPGPSGGPPGPQGPAGTIQVGSVTASIPGGSPTITNTGTAAAAILNFVLPRGDTGPQGQQGPSATLAIGTVSTGAPGSEVIITNSGSNTAAIWNVTIPRGNIGARGPQGPATIDVHDTHTGLPGTQAHVENVGTDEDALLDFTIPRGTTIKLGETHTSAAGGEAEVHNSGTAHDLILDFTLPRGVQGPSGGFGSDEAPPGDVIHGRRGAPHHDWQPTLTAADAFPEAPNASPHLRQGGNQRNWVLGVPLSGNVTMTGPLTLPNTNATGNQAVRFTQLDTYLAKSGGTMTGQIVLPAQNASGNQAVRFAQMEAALANVTGFLPLAGGTLNVNAIITLRAGSANTRNYRFGPEGGTSFWTGLTDGTGSRGCWFHYSGNNAESQIWASGRIGCEGPISSDGNISAGGTVQGANVSANSQVWGNTVVANGITSYGNAIVGATLQVGGCDILQWAGYLYLGNNVNCRMPHSLWTGGGIESAEVRTRNAVWFPGDYYWSNNGGWMYSNASIQGHEVYARSTCQGHDVLARGTLIANGNATIGAGLAINGHWMVASGNWFRCGGHGIEAAAFSTGGNLSAHDVDFNIISYNWIKCKHWGGVPLAVWSESAAGWVYIQVYRSDWQGLISIPYSSDIRYKCDIRPATIDALAAIDRLEMISYRKLDRSDPENLDTQHVNCGVNGQQLQTVMPDAVVPIKPTEQIPDPELTLNPVVIDGYMLRAIQQLSARVTALEQKHG
jgi:hypothetical protein